MQVNSVAMEVATQAGSVLEWPPVASGLMVLESLLEVVEMAVARFQRSN